jgi:hypothetical protein
MYCSADQQLLGFEISVSRVFAFVIFPSCVQRWVLVCRDG